MATYTTNKPAVRDSFDDDEVSDDVDDEVFIRDGKNGFKMNDDRGAKRPLMAPRRKAKSSSGNQFHSETCKQPQCKTFCVPCCYGISALVALFGLVSLVVVVINMFPIPFDRLRIWSQSMGSREKVILPCTDLKTKVVWAKSFPQLTSEAALKLNDVNKDGILDVIVGYGTGADAMGLGEEVCETLALGSAPCLGGVLALDGRSGEVLWQHRTYRSVLFVDCSTDLTGDAVNDCVVSGKGGVLSALNGGDGKVVWELKMPLNKEEVDVYAAQFIADVDFDLVPDILTAHSSIQAGTGQGHLVLLSGRTGSRLVQVPTPHYESIYNPPHTLVRPDGTNMLLFATGSVDTPGGLYIVPLHHLVSGNISQGVQLIRGGVNDSPVLVDLNNDGTEDIVAISGDKVIAIDSLSLNQLWNTSTTSAFGKLQLLNSPTAAYFNDDNVPDLLFTHMVGNSYPEYYFSQTSVVDGRTGLLLLDQPVISSSATDTLGLSLSMSGNGNNFFLYWTAVCVGQEHTQQRFSFLNNTPIRQRAKADLCRLRFNSTLDLRLYGISQHTAPPGILLYSSERQWKEDHNSTTSEAPVQSSWQPALPQQQQQKQQQQQPETQHLNNFHHTGDSVEELKNSHHTHSTFHRPQYDSERPMSLEDYERLQQQRRPYAEWHPQEPAYGNNQPFQNPRYSNLGMFGNPQLEGLPDLDPGYNPEGEDPPMFPPNSLGRDEREETQNRPRRSVTSTLLPRVGSPGVLTPSLDSTTVDMVMTTHWLPAADNVNVRLPRDEQCIQDRMARIDTEKYVDLETLRATVEAECYAHHGVSRTPSHNNGGYLVVTRRALVCECDVVNVQGEVCTSPLAHAQQNLPQRGPSTFFKPQLPPSSSLLA